MAPILSTRYFQSARSQHYIDEFGREYIEKGYVLMRNVYRHILLSLPLLSVSAFCASFPEPAIDAKPSTSKQTAVLAGGCFWCTEAVFEIIDGVEDVISGYSGGTKDTAKYDIVSTGRTGHAEAILITYDPAKISYGQLLKIFFSVAHDPTTLNRQGADIGPQYRSAIFYTDEEQKRIAEAYIKQIDDAHVLSKPIVTQVVALDKFYTAEGYHQNYAGRNRSNPYIVNVSDPKVEKLKKLYPGCVRKRKS